MLLPNPMGELSEEVKPLIPDISPIEPSILLRTPDSKPLSYRIGSPAGNYEPLNLIELNLHPPSEFGLAVTDNFIIDKAATSDIIYASIPAATANSSPTTPTTTLVDPLIGSNSLPEEATADLLTNPGSDAITYLAISERSKSETTAINILDSATSEIAATATNKLDRPNLETAITVADIVDSEPSQTATTVTAVGIAKLTKTETDSVENTPDERELPVASVDRSDDLIELTQTEREPTFTSLSIASASIPTNPGTFIVKESGTVKFDYVFDGGYYEGELAIFSLTGMEAFTPGTPEFAAEAARRALTNSTEGHIVIRDNSEGAKFIGAMPSESDFGAGQYQGGKTFTMTPGDTFGVMLVPSRGVQLAYEHPWLGAIFPEHRPLISIPGANPNDTSYLLPIADLTGNGNTFALEDMSAGSPTDGDYNDIIFKIDGATGRVPEIDGRSDPDREWRNTTLGQQILDYVNNSNSDNNPPVVSPASIRTYTELETTISLENLATDAEGDPLTISVLNPVNGTVIFNPSTKEASFKPAPGFAGIASFDFLASDGFASSTPATVTVNVSNVGLLNLDLVRPIGNSNNDSNPLTPTFKWDFKSENETFGIPGFNPDTDVSEVNLYVSVFPQGKGLLPQDRWDGLNSADDKDYNPNRILTARWANGMWTGNGISKAGSPEEFALSSDRMLTAGQQYHWAVEAVTKQGERKVVTDKFETLLPDPIDEGNTFSSVTVLTRGLEPENTEYGKLIDSQLNGVAKQIYDVGGAVKKYNATTGKWQSVIPQANDWIFDSNSRSPAPGKPLVLLADWMEGIEPQKLDNSGFAEAAADALFASMVQLDLEKGGSIGSQGILYDSTGKLIRTSGSVFNSPLHFVGFGQGAVVNSEIIQRLGTFFPNAGGTSRANRDLQMTTVDPYNYNSNSLSGHYSNILDPEIRVWNNVTYADNYYQTNGIGNTLNGRVLSGTNWQSDWNVWLNDLAGFMPDDGAGASHRAAGTWYAGTANLNESKLPLENGNRIYRRSGDFELNNITDAVKNWYAPDHTKANFTGGNGVTNAPWEGIGTGWFYSVLGGGSQLRSYDLGGKKGKNELGNFEDYLNDNRAAVSEDNTYSFRMRGDYAVPTLFNGNFDAIALKTDSKPIPGWSLYNGEIDVDRDVTQQYLINLNQISQIDNPPLYDSLEKLDTDRTQPNYALKLGGANGLTEIIHNPFVVPDWGVLRFDLHAFNPNGGEVKVSMKGSEPGDNWQYLSAIESQNTTETNLRYGVELVRGGVRDRSGFAFNQISYGMQGFETFHFDVPEALRGKSAMLRFETAGNTEVYLDDIFFKSKHLLLGNPGEARFTRGSNPNPQNFLIERPQYTLSYSDDNKTPNWASWQLNKTWISNEERKDTFHQDDTLPPDWDRVPKNSFPDGWTRGHLTPNADRNRNLKDMDSTYFMTNMIPQHSNNNSGVWGDVEDFARKIVEDKDKELYIIAGGYGSQGTFIPKPPPDNITFEVNIPDRVWKIMVVLDRPGQKLADLNANTQIIAVDFPNSTVPDGPVSPKWTNYIIDIATIEKTLAESGMNYDLLSNISEDIKSSLKTKKFTFTGNQPLNGIR
ncbi:MAG: DNA/RNA non-specific endonuclease [Microcoleus sp.]